MSRFMFKDNDNNQNRPDPEKNAASKKRKF